MANEIQAERPEHGDQKSAEELIQYYGAVRLILALGLTVGIECFELVAAPDTLS